MNESDLPFRKGKAWKEWLLIEVITQARLAHPKNSTLSLAARWSHRGRAA
jgi:hypothetical protein